MYILWASTNMPSRGEHRNTHHIHSTWRCFLVESVVPAFDAVWAHNTTTCSVVGWGVKWVDFTRCNHEIMSRLCLCDKNSRGGTEVSVKVTCGGEESIR